MTAQAGITADQLSDIASTNLSLALRHEIAVISASQGVREDSVKAQVRTGDNAIWISFSLQTETPVECLNTSILPEEPIALVYMGIEHVGISAPIVLSGRDDFPRHLGHLNPVLPSQPVSFCLARTGLQPIYDRFGVEGVLARLRVWLRDAVTGSLMDDGWEPVPIAAKMPTRGGLMNIAALQEIAARHHDAAGWTTGVAKITAPDCGNYIFVDPKEVSATVPQHDSQLAKATRMRDADRGQISVPWVFIWSSDESPISEPIFGAWRNYNDVRSALSGVGLSEKLDEAIGLIRSNGCDCRHSPGRKTLAILIGLWRPAPLADNIFGLSTNPIARRLEILAITLEAAVSSDPLADNARLQAVISSPLPAPELLRWVTGTPGLRPVSLIGYGALGSAITDHLLRSGIDEMIGIDHDVMMPHNLARHTGDIDDVYKPKISGLEHAARRVAVEALKPRARPIQRRVDEFSDGELATSLGLSALVIDATADERVRGRLALFSAFDWRPTMRVEIFNKGRLGVQFVASPAKNPNLLDLYYLLCREALNDNDVAEWLFEEDTGGVKIDELTLGFGCASATTQLSNFVVAQHASAFMPSIFEVLGGRRLSGIGLNVLDDAFRPRGWRWVDAIELMHFEPASTPGWTVRIHPEVADLISSERVNALPLETGGYLYGKCDIALKQIVVVAASTLPPGSKASRAGVTLGEAGKTGFEKRLFRRTRGRLQLCGSWHSHPNRSTALSRKDLATMAKFRRLDAPRGVPTLFVVVAESAVAAHLQVD